MSSKPRVLVAIVTYNSEATIGKCISDFGYLAQSTDFTSQLIIADNASADDTRRVAESAAAAIQGLDAAVVQSPSNLGWGAGNNLAIRNASPRPDYVLLCNPDAGINEDGLLALIDALRSFPGSAGIAVPFVESGGGVTIGAFADRRLGTFILGDLVSTRWTQIPFRCRYGRKRGTFRIKSGYASGGLSLFDHQALQSVGLFDESIFFMSDDIDASRAILRRGYALVGVASAIGYHLGGQGSEMPGSDNPSADRNMLAFKSELRFVEKWHGPRWAWALAWYRATAFYPVASGIRRLAGKKPVEDQAVREFARAYLTATTKQTKH